MTLLRCEIRRLLKSRMTLLLLALSLAATLLFAYLPTTYSYINYTDEMGQTFELRGMKSIRYQKTLKSAVAGIVTPEKIRQAVEIYQACLNEYGVKYSYDLPEGVYETRILPYAPLLHCVKEAFADPETGMAPTVMEIDPSQIENFYSACATRLTSLMKMSQPDHPCAQRAAASMYENVRRPFTFYPGSDNNAMDYQVLLSFVLTLFCVLITAPVFSSDYQSGADDVMRCARHGRTRLAAVKVFSSLFICASTYTLCTALFLFISNSLWGWECTRTSVQMVYSVASLPAFTMGELQIFIALTSLLSLLAMASLALYLSSKCTNTVIALSLSLLLCLLPLIVYYLLPGTVGTLLRCLLPSGGVSLQSSYLYALMDFEFLNAGSFALWVPHALLAASCMEMPIFLLLAFLAHVTRSR